MIYYAHSGIKEKNIKAQLYCDHINNVIKLSDSYSDIFSEQGIRDSVFLAALYHDIGKLDKDSQIVLSSDVTIDKKIINHVDAGVAILKNIFSSTKNLTYLVAAWLVHAHHRGLSDMNDIIKKKETLDFIGYRYEYDILEDIRDQKISSFIDSQLNDYIDISKELLMNHHSRKIEQLKKIPSCMHFRMALSCLVDADHGDTAQHYGAPSFNEIDLNATKRYAQVVSYISGLPSKGASPERIESRKMLFEVNKNIDIRYNFYLEDAPVGTGKTFSLLTGALKIAKERNKKRIFTILPFTNVISQTVDEYRKCSILPNEDSKKIVNEIHSKCEYGHFLLRKYSQLWNAPLNVSTAVQFFESMFSNHPVGVRKLRQFCNSVVIIDEFHSAVPHVFWNVILDNMKIMSECFGTVFMFGSGSSCRYWELFEKNINIYEVVDGKVYEKLQTREKNRVKIKFSQGHDIDSLVSFIQEKSVGKSALVVAQTVNNAYRIAQRINNRIIYFLSSSLTPVDRERVLTDIKKNLHKPIIVVATSIIECGVDISFDVGFKEFSGFNSILQFNGRINRNGIDKKAITYVFDFDEGIDEVTVNPQMKKAIAVAKSFSRKDINPKNCTDAVNEELGKKGIDNSIKLHSQELNHSFKSVAADMKVIVSDTVNIIVNKSIIESMKKGLMVNSADITRNSVQVWATKLEKISEYVEMADDRMYYWTGTYDDIYGIAKILVDK